MIELYSDIRKEVRDTADMIWKLCLTKNSPLASAKYLNTMLNYYKNVYTKEEVDFLQFYFELQMEMMKK